MDRIAQTVEPAGHSASFRLWAFLAASLCIHTAILLLLRWNPTVDSASGSEPALSMTLSLAKAAVPKPTVLPPRATSPVHGSDQRPVHGTSHVQPKTRPVIARTSASPRLQAQTVKPVQPALSQPSPPAELSALPAYAEVTDTARIEPRDAQPEGGRNDTELAKQSARAQIETLILTDLTRRFAYPALARRRGWQGTVLLALTVKPSGALDRIHVARSSGYELLDRSAVDTMRHVDRIAQAGRWLGGQTLELQLPVVYRLTE